MFVIIGVKFERGCNLFNRGGFWLRFLAFVIAYVKQLVRCSFSSGLVLDPPSSYFRPCPSVFLCFLD